MEKVRPVIWIGSSRRDLRAMLPEVRRNFGQALYTAQQGMTDPAAKPLKGFAGTRVMEIVELQRDLCPACIPKEVKARHRDP
jgi:phage-related protein